METERFSETESFFRCAKLNTNAESELDTIQLLNTNQEIKRKPFG